MQIQALQVCWLSWDKKHVEVQTRTQILLNCIPSNRIQDFLENFPLQQKKPGKLKIAFCAFTHIIWAIFCQFQYLEMLEKKTLIIVMYCLQITLPNFLLYMKIHFWMLLTNIFDYDIKSTFL